MKLINNKLSYYVPTMDELINGSCNGSRKSHINILYNPIITFFKINIPLGLCDTSNVGRGDKTLDWCKRNEMMMC